jgi:predicted O-methyltransferase YrrM
MEFVEKIYGLIRPKQGQYDWRDNWHEDFIVHLAKITKPSVYVELGLYRCSLFNKMVPFAGKLYGVDINPDADKFMKKNQNAFFFNMKTDEFAEKLRRDPLVIDMIFIDADHSKNAVIRDFFNFFPYVRPHGLILLHDTHPRSEFFTQPDYCGDGYKAIEEISRESKGYEMVTIPVHPGLTLIRKKNTQISWQEKEH